MSIGMSGKAAGGRPSSQQRAKKGQRSQQGQRTQRAASRKPKTKAEGVEFEEDDEDDEVELDTASKKGSGKLDVKVIAVAVLGLGILIVGCMLFLGKDNTTDVQEPATMDTVQNTIEGFVEDSQSEVVTDVDGNPVYDGNGNVIGKDAINPGYVTELDNMSDGSVPAQVFDADDYIADLNGVAVSGKYNVESIDVVEDYVSYELKRAIIDSGMEMYWAEIEYEGKKYRAQMSYTKASKFKDKGIAKAQLEILNVVGGGKIISYIAMEIE